jgi:hypothetical protein
MQPTRGSELFFWLFDDAPQPLLARRPFPEWFLAPPAEGLALVVLLKKAHGKRLDPGVNFSWIKSLLVEVSDTRKQLRQSKKKRT